PRCQVQVGGGEEFHQVFGDGHARGQAGGADPADEDVVLGGVDVDEVVAVVDRRAQARVGRGDLFVEQGWHQGASLAEQEFESGFGGAGSAACLEVFFCGSGQDVAVEGRADQHALASGGGNGEHDARHHRAGQLVEDQHLTAARGDGESVVADLAVEVVGAQAGSVDDPAAADVAGGGDQGGVVGVLGA